MNAIISIKILLITILIMGCSSSDDVSTSPLATLIGGWLYTYPNQCVETNNFNSNGSWNESALDEIQSGTYTFVQNNSGGKHTLTVQITDDNGLPGCNGNSIDGTGVSAIVYVVFSTSTAMEWYLNENDKSPAVVLTKQ